MHTMFRAVPTSTVVPYVGTWIEMSAYVIALPVALVVPYVGTWIEIKAWRPDFRASSSFPTWERG